MFDNLYENIGGKIKGWAKWIFIVEAIGAIITGFSLITADAEDPSMTTLYGLLILVLGPFVALVSTWLLYAFGELVEKTASNEKNTRDLLKYIKDNYRAPQPEEKSDDNKSTPFKATSPKNENKTPEKSYSPTATFEAKDNGTIVCSQCNYTQPKTRKVCWHCGASFETGEKSNAPYRCGKCGHEGPYEGACPECGSSIKVHMVSTETNTARQ